MGLGDFLFGKKDKVKKFDQYNSQQKKFLGGYLNQAQAMQQRGGGYTESLGLLQQFLNPQSSVYKNFQQPYMQQFNEQILPNIAERYAGMGANGGGLSSSGFAQSLGAAGSQLQTNLAQMKSGLQHQSIQDLLNQYNQMAATGLGAQSFGMMHRPGNQGMIPSMATNVAGSLARGLGSYMGGM